MLHQVFKRISETRKGTISAIKYPNFILFRIVYFYRMCLKLRQFDINSPKLAQVFGCYKVQLFNTYRIVPPFNLLFQTFFLLRPAADYFKGKLSVHN